MSSIPGRVVLGRPIKQSVFVLLKYCIIASFAGVLLLMRSVCPNIRQRALLMTCLSSTVFVVLYSLLFGIFLGYFIPRTVLSCLR